MSKKTWAAISKTGDRGAIISAAIVGLLALSRSAGAQPVLASSPTIPVTPPAMLQQTNEMEVFAPENISTEQPFQYGTLIFRPHPYYQYLYAEGIQANPGQAVNTSIQQFSPGFQVDFGTHWTVDYTPTWTDYSSGKFRNTFDQAVKLAGATTYEDWVFGLAQSYVSSSAPLVETGTQTKQENYTTTFNATCLINSKMSLDLSVNQDFNYADQLNSWREWSTLDWLNYQFWPRLSAALGAGFGYVDVDSGANMTYEQFQGRINWRATDKISFQIHGGLEDRQFLASGTSDQLNPVASAMIEYQPFEYTKLSLKAERTIAASLLTVAGGNQITESSAIGGHLNQRLLQHFFLDLDGAYNTVKYVTSGGSATDREDDYYSFNVKLSTTFLKRGTIAVFYQISHNTSNQSLYSYSSHQVGFEVGFRY